jgi:phage-related protein
MTQYPHLLLSRVVPVRLLDCAGHSRLPRYARSGIIAVGNERESDSAPAGAEEKPVFWVASSRKDLKKFPKAVRTTFGQAIYDAQIGGKHPAAKPLKGFRGAGVLEVVEDDNGNTYRAVYTVKFAGVVYVLHAFQKKSRSGASTPPEEIQKVRARLKDAEQHHAQWRAEQEQQDPADGGGVG